MNVKIIWSNFLNNIKTELNPLSFETWFQSTELYEYKDGICKIIVPMEMYKKHLTTKYYDLMIQTLNEVVGEQVDIQFFTKEELEEQEQKIEEINSVNHDNFINKEEIFNSNLDKKYNFENFIVGNTNKFAQAAALEIAENPGALYNPLFIYGNSGLGKTHLMHAIGNYALKNNKSRVLYVTSEKFVDDFIGINKKNQEGNNFDSVKLFKKKYRDVDILIIDDIQYLGNGLKTQQEFFNTFNELYDKNKQIVISSDRSPDDLKLLEDRLRTRFNWGITINIEPPEFELRLNIIEKKLEGHMLNTPFPKEVQEYIASNCTSDIRKIEGAITRVIAYAAMMNGCNIDLDLANEALKGYFANTVISKNKIEQVQQLVAKNYNITVDDLKSKRRISTISFPRQVAMYICRVYLKESYPKIGIEFGGKDHTTVMHSVDKIKKELEKQPYLKDEIDKIINKLN